ncbi:zinc-dependent alcohol dehydrogenase [Castellaniella sp.]|uniref:zinc-dependent alcohol dehydrogenase n=1 Tax=Castellaniella sp. TaxID=1955812 RepID=UPI002AFEE3D4|nr:zinc-binding dehydrogenase [Castellaniella sp.]
MKCAVYYGPRDVRLEDRPIPEPGSGQLLVRVDYVGICGTDVHSYQMAGIISPVRVLGHETVGTVVRIGSGVKEFAVGDQILCGPPTRCRENCPSCRRGETNICINGFPRTAGIGELDGGYAEYLLVNDVRHTMLIKVPAGVNAREAVLFDVVCVAFHGIRKSRFRLGDNVVISGGGSIGLSAIALLKLAGANKIIALEVAEDKHDIMRAYGADYVLNPKRFDDVGAKIRDILGTGVGADVVFECVGRADSLETCVMQCVRPGGQVMLIGAGGEPLSLATARFVPHEIDLQCSFVYTEDEVRTYLELMAVGKIDFSTLVTDVIHLEDCVERGLERLSRPGNGQIKILIAPSA